VPPETIHHRSQCLLGSCLAFADKASSSSSPSSSRRSGPEALVLACDALLNGQVPPPSSFSSPSAGAGGILVVGEAGKVATQTPSHRHNNETRVVAAALDYATDKLGVPAILEATDFPHEEVWILFVAELVDHAPSNESNRNHLRASDTANAYLASLVAAAATATAVTPVVDQLWRLKAVERQLKSVLVRERKQRRDGAATTASCLAMQEAMLRLGSKRREGMRRLKELHEEVHSLESEVLSSRLEASKAKTTELGYAKQLQGLSSSNERFLAQLQRLERELGEAKEKAAAAAEAGGAAAAASEAAVSDKDATDAALPKGFLRLTVLLGSSSWQYVCDGQLPVSWLLSQVLRDCDEKLDIVGLKLVKQQQQQQQQQRPQLGRAQWKWQRRRKRRLARRSRRLLVPLSSPLHSPLHSTRCRRRPRRRRCF